MARRNWTLSQKKAIVREYKNATPSRKREILEGHRLRRSQITSWRQQIAGHNGMESARLTGWRKVDTGQKKEAMTTMTLTYQSVAESLLHQNTVLQKTNEALLIAIKALSGNLKEKEQSWPTN
jgi:transposase-like protein